MALMSRARRPTSSGPPPLISWSYSPLATRRTSLPSWTTGRVTSQLNSRPSTAPASTTTAAALMSSPIRALPVRCTSCQRRSRTPVSSSWNPWIASTSRWNRCRASGLVIAWSARGPPARTKAMTGAAMSPRHESAWAVTARSRASSAGSPASSLAVSSASDFSCATAPSYPPRSAACPLSAYPRSALSWRTTTASRRCALTSAGLIRSVSRVTSARLAAAVPVAARAITPRSTATAADRAVIRRPSVQRVALLGLADEPGRDLVPRQYRSPWVGEQLAQALDTQPLTVGRRPAFDEPVGVEQQRPVVGQPDFGGRTWHAGLDAEHQTGRRIAQLHAVRPEQQHRRRMAGEPDPGRAVVEVDGDHRDRGEHLVVAALADQHLFQGVQHRVVGYARQHQRAPGHPELRAEGRLVGAVAAHVAHEQVQPAGRRLDRVEEVPAEQGPVPAGPVEREDPRARRVHQGLGEQSAFQPRRLGLPQLGLAELAGVLVGPAALDRVPDGTGEGDAVHLAFDEIVLGAGTDGRDAQVLILQPGEYAHRHAGGRVQHLVQPVEPAGVGQPQVEQDTVHADQPLPGLRHGRNRLDVQRCPGLQQLLLDQEGVGRVVFDQEYAQSLAGRS